MDIMTLARDVVDLLAPALPVLTGVGQSTAGQTAGETVSDMAKTLWAILRPGVEAKPAAWEAFQFLATHPDDEAARAALRLQLMKLLADDPLMVIELATATGHTAQLVQYDQIGEAKALAIGDDVIERDQARGQRAKPPAKPPSAEPLIEEQIRLDVAAPESVEVDHTFEIAVRVSQPDSPVLSEETLTKVTSRPGRVYRRADEQAVRYRIGVSAADCKVHTPEQEFLLYPGQDSEVIYFQLTPLRAGAISVIVSAYQPDNLLAASARIRVTVSTQATEVRPQVTSTLSDVGQALSEVAPAEADLKLKLYTVLNGDAFSLDDLEDLSFRLDVDWDSLSGDNKAKKARSLVLNFARRDQLARLQEAVLEARPELKDF